MTETRWSGKQVAQIVGVSYDTVDYWVKNGLIIPDSVVLTNDRKQLIYSFSNIVAIAAIKELRDRGISLQHLKKAQREFCKRIGLSFEQGLTGGIIVADGKEILSVLYTLDDEAIKVMSLLRGGQFILPLDNIVIDITKKIEILFGDRASSLVSSIPQMQGANNEY